MLSSSAHFATVNGSKYLQQLCKHFAHKVEVTFDEHSARALLGPGPATLKADETGLFVEVTAPDLRGLIEARYVVDKHLVTFAFRDGFGGFAWALDA